VVSAPPLHEEVRAQLAALSLDPGRPLVITDADEVVLQFVAALELFLAGRGLYLDLSSYALTGNIRRVGSGEPESAEAVKELLADFFEERVEHVTPVPGAAEALTALSRRAQVIVLSNVPFGRRAARQRALKAHGMDFPVVANHGPKGAAVAEIAGRIAAPVVFVDDIPSNIASVAKAAPQVTRLHFIADARLARLSPPCPECHARHDDWPSARAFIEAALAAGGW
jgi:phosphoglycolate phosphatase-like HAD superfamily hydrolase